MTSERIRTLEERANKSLDQVEEIIEGIIENAPLITWQEWAIISPFIVIFAGDPPMNQGGAYKRGRALMEKFLQADNFGKMDLKKDNRTRKQRGMFSKETPESASTFARDFSHYHNEARKQKERLEAYFAYTSLYLRSIKGDELALHKALEILGGDRMAEALEIYNQGMNFQDISEPEDADNMRGFIEKTIVLGLKGIREYNLFLTRLTEREELEELNFIACCYIDESELSLDLYTDGLAELKEAITINTVHKLQLVDWIFPEIREDGAYYKDGKKVPFNSDEKKIKSLEKYLENQLKEEKIRDFKIYGTFLYG
jgi:hypothetical protein